MWTNITTTEDEARGFEVQINLETNEYRHRKKFPKIGRREMVGGWISGKPPSKNVKKPILCLDFDGVCHSYTSRWQGADVIPDPPVPGLFEFLEQAAPHFEIHIFSSRSLQPGGIEAMMAWFYWGRKKWREDGGQGREIIEINFPREKPAAFLSLDDRAVTFTGTWPDVEWLKAFKPWYKK